MKRAPDAMLPVWVYALPSAFAFQPDGALRGKVRSAVASGSCRVIAGPTECHVMIDVKRPYYRQMEAVE